LEEIITYCNPKTYKKKDYLDVLIFNLPIISQTKPALPMNPAIKSIAALSEAVAKTTQSKSKPNPNNLNLFMVFIYL